MYAVKMLFSGQHLGEGLQKRTGFRKVGAQTVRNINLKDMRSSALLCLAHDFSFVFWAPTCKVMAIVKKYWRLNG